MALKQVYLDLGNGQCVSTTSAFDPVSGQYVRGRGTPGQVTTVAQAVSRGMPVLPPATQSMSMSGEGPATGPIGPAIDTDTGAQGLFRNQYTGAANGTVRTYSIGFLNGSGGDVTAFMGDGNTIAYQSQGGTPLPGTVTISGTWGAESFAIWRLVTCATPVYVDKIRIAFDANSYLSAGQLNLYKTLPDTVFSTQNLNINIWLSTDQYQPLIVENPSALKLTWDASIALAALLPAGRTVTFTFFYVSVGDVHGMRLVAPGR